MPQDALGDQRQLLHTGDGVVMVHTYLVVDSEYPGLWDPHIHIGLDVLNMTTNSFTTHTPTGPCQR